jgi:HEAT repeat protein
MDRVQHLIEELEQGSPKIRRRAARILGNTRDSRAIMSLIKALKDNDVSIQLEARDGLVNTGKPAIQTLIQALKTEIGWSYVHDVLVRIGEPAIQALIDALEDPYLKDDAAFVLSRFERRAIKPLVKSLGRPEIREEVASTLSLEAGLYGEPVAESLLKALAIPAYRTGALTTLRRIILSDIQRQLPLLLRVLTVLKERRLMDDATEHIRAFIPPLISLLSGQSRYDASAALRMIGNPATPRLVNLIKNKTKDEHARWCAVHILGEIGDPEGIEVLIKALEDENPLVSIQAAESLGKIGDSRALKPLLSVLSSGRTALSEKVIEAFMKSPSLKQALADFNQEASTFLCMRCLSRFEKQKVKSLSGHSLVFFSCRICNGVSYIMEDIEKVVVLLDDKWVEDIFDYRKLPQESGKGAFGILTPSNAEMLLDHRRCVSGNQTLYTNWLDNRELFDFDEVWVKNVDDFDIDEFVMKVRNNTDTHRGKKLNLVPVYVFPNAGLSQAKVNLLRGTFTRVETKAPEE